MNIAQLRYLLIAGVIVSFMTVLHCLQYTLQGIKRCEAEQRKSYRISVGILQIKAVWDIRRKFGVMV